MDPYLEIPSRIQDPSLKPLHPLYADSWASFHVNMIAWLREAAKKGSSFNRCAIKGKITYFNFIFLTAKKIIMALSLKKRKKRKNATSFNQFKKAYFSKLITEL